MAAIAGKSSKDRENRHISDEEFKQDQSAVIKNLMARTKELEDKLSIMKDAEVKASTDDQDKLKPIDIKDIERPDKYDKLAAKFNNWFDKFKDLLTSRNGNWEKLLGMIENRGKGTIKSQEEFINRLDDATCKSIREQSDTYAQHSKSYLRTYTYRELHSRVTQTDYDEVMELMREVIYRGRNQNPNRLIDLKEQVLSPPQANKASEPRQDADGMETHTRKMIVEEDPKYKMDDETMQTILLKIMPPEYVKDSSSRKGSTRTITSVSSRLCSTRSTRGRWMKSRGRKVDEINALNSSGDDDKVKRNAGWHRVRGSGDTVGGMAVQHLCGEVGHRITAVINFVSGGSRGATHTKTWAASSPGVGALLSQTTGVGTARRWKKQIIWAFSWPCAALAQDMGVPVSKMEESIEAHYQASLKTVDDPDGGPYPAYPSGEAWDEASGKTGSGKKFHHNVISEPTSRHSPTMLELFLQ